MKHRIRINGEIKEMDFELGTYIYDKHGNEIFEGDIITVDFAGIKKSDGYLCKSWKEFAPLCRAYVHAGRKIVLYFIRPVRFYDGKVHETTYAWRYFWEFRDQDKHLEVVGHVDELE